MSGSAQGKFCWLSQAMTFCLMSCSWGQLIAFLFSFWVGCLCWSLWVWNGISLKGSLIKFCSLGWRCHFWCFQSDLFHLQRKDTAPQGIPIARISCLQANCQCCNRHFHFLWFWICFSICSCWFWTILTIYQLCITQHHYFSSRIWDLSRISLTNFWEKIAITQLNLFAKCWIAVLIALALLYFCGIMFPRVTILSLEEVYLEKSWSAFEIVANPHRYHSFRAHPSRPRLLANLNSLNLQGKSPTRSQFFWRLA
jgi:hypothetical protein